MGDAADQITIAIENVFPMAIRLTCWAHVQRAYEAQLAHIDDKEIMKNVGTDIYNLQLSFSKENFETNCRLFFEKWEKIKNKSLEVFMKYFKKEWIVSKHCNWYEGAALCFPSTNNALESYNKSIII